MQDTTILEFEPLPDSIRTEVGSFDADSPMVLKFRPLPEGSKRKLRRKTKEQHYLELIVATLQLAEGDETARQSVTASLTALYWKFGRDTANEAMDQLCLGRLGFAGYDL